MTLRWDTPFCRLVGIEAPVVRAPVGGISTPALAAAVSEVGGLGTLSITWREPDQPRSLLRETRSYVAPFHGDSRVGMVCFTAIATGCRLHVASTSVACLHGQTLLVSPVICRT
jgi:NAD(P)H-dependent flavin oxidoreductase YrpB (nitropropane dioxygenase family)